MDDCRWAVTQVNLEVTEQRPLFYSCVDAVTGEIEQALILPAFC